MEEVKPKRAKRTKSAGNCISNTNSPCKPAPYTRQADILADALINDTPEVMGVDQLSPSVQAQIIAGRLNGYHPVSVRWPTGEFALMFCEPGRNMPQPARILEAYYQCRRTNKAFPEGSHS